MSNRLLKYCDTNFPGWRRSESSNPVDFIINHLERQKEALSVSEALYGFAALLTVRDKPIVVGSAHGCTPVVEVLSRFMKTNNIDVMPRENWTDYLVPTEHGEETNMTGAKEGEISKAIGVLTKALKTDPDYRRSWTANIAMCVYDTYREDNVATENRKSFHSICNLGAERFIELLCRDSSRGNPQPVSDEQRAKGTAEILAEVKQATEDYFKTYPEGAPARKEDLKRDILKGPYNYCTNPDDQAYIDEHVMKISPMNPDDHQIHISGDWVAPNSDERPATDNTEEV